MPTNSISSLESLPVETSQNDTLLTNRIDAQQDLSSGCSFASEISHQTSNEINDYPTVSSNYVPLETIGFSETQDD